MFKIVIKTCSCFIDRAIWFINLPHLHNLNPWYFEPITNYSYKDRKEELLDNYFIKEIRTMKTLVGSDNDYKMLIKITIIKSCFDCFKFSSFFSEWDFKNFFVE